MTEKDKSAGITASVKKVVLAQEANGSKRGIELELTLQVGGGRLPVDPVPTGFEIWSSTPNEVMDWIFRGELAQDHPAAQQWAAAQYILSKKEKIQTDGVALLEAVTIIAKNELVMPDWMAAVYIERFSKIQRMEIGSLDEAFGPLPFKTGPRLDGRRRRRQLILKINKALVEALNRDPNKAIDAGLFDEIGLLPEIAQSGSFVEKAYYEGVREHGLQDLSMMKRLLLFPFK